MKLIPNIGGTVENDSAILEKIWIFFVYLESCYGISRQATAIPALVEMSATHYRILAITLSPIYSDTTQSNCTSS